MTETVLDPIKRRDAWPRRCFAPDPLIEAYKQGIDQTLIRENWKLTPEERLIKATQLQRFAEELRDAGRRLRAGQR